MSEEVKAARETRDGIIWDKIPNHRSRVTTDDELLELIKKE